MARWIVLAGITALFVIGYFATSETQSKNDGLGRRNAYTITSSLQKQAEAALSRIGADRWASVVVDGQTAILNGEAPTDSDRQDAIDAVKTSEWSGGKWIGGVTVVRNATTVAKATSPYEWVATLGETGSVRLSGHVPGQKHRRAIKAAAQRLFSKEVEDQMTIAQGAPTGPWTDTAIFALAQLSQLTSGEAHFKNKVVLISGTAPNAAVQTEIQQAAEGKIDKPYRGETDIRAVSAFDQAAPATEPAPSTIGSVAAPLATTPLSAGSPIASPGTPPAPAPLSAGSPIAPAGMPPATAPLPTASALTPPATAPLPVPPPVASTAAPTATPPPAPALTAATSTAPAPAPATPPPLSTPAPTPAPPPAPTPTPALTPAPAAGTEPTAQHDGLECQKTLDKVMTNNTIAFAVGSDEIRSVTHEMLNNLARIAAKCPLKVKITGHTDARENEPEDASLSQRRADAVARYLIGKGVARKRVRAAGVGSDQPVGTSDTSVGQSKNRRVEITVTN